MLWPVLLPCRERGGGGENEAHRLSLVHIPWRWIFCGTHRTSLCIVYTLSCYLKIYGPDGGALTEPVDPGVETIVYADISLSKIGEVKLVADTMGN